MLKVAVHANHRAIEHYLYSLLPDIQFIRSGADGAMHLRDMPDNCLEVGGKKKVIAEGPDLGIARSAEAVKWYRKNGLPTIWFLSGPPQPGQKERRRPQLEQCQASVAYSEEHAEMWSDPKFPTCYVAHYPIDTEAFKGYEGGIKKVLMIATMRMGWWAHAGGNWKGTEFFKQCLDMGIPYQLVGFDNEKDGDMWAAANPYPINDEAAMVQCLADHRVYGHTGSFLCRSPLEALATGAPVVIRHSPVGHYLSILPHGEGVYRAVNDNEFIGALQHYLWDHEAAKKMGALGRQRVQMFFHPDFVREQWMVAIEGALNAQNS